MAFDYIGVDREGAGEGAADLYWKAGLWNIGVALQKIHIQMDIANEAEGSLAHKSDSVLDQYLVNGPCTITTRSGVTHEGAVELFEKDQHWIALRLPDSSQLLLSLHAIESIHLLPR